MRKVLVSSKPRGFGPLLVQQHEDTPMRSRFSQPIGNVSKEPNKQTIARIYGVKQSEVSYLKAGLMLTGVKVLYDQSTQLTYTCPPSTSTVVSWSGPQLNTTDGTLHLVPYGYSSVANMRKCNPTGNNEKIYLSGLVSGSSAGSGYFYYDALDSTSTDNGWFIIVTSTGKRLKRVGMYSNLQLEWAGVVNGSDLAKPISDAANWLRAAAANQDSLFRLPVITLNSGDYVWNSMITIPPYIKIVGFGDIRITSSLTREQARALLTVSALGDTINFYRDDKGIQFPRIFSCIGGRFKFNHTGEVTHDLRPSVFYFNHGGGETFNNCMSISEVESEDFFTVLDIHPVNFWGFRAENCVFNGHYGVYFGSGGANSGERITFSNCWIAGRWCAFYLAAVNFQIQLQSCSLDFSGYVNDDSLPGHVFYKPSAGWCAISMDGGHIENFKGLLVNNPSGFSNTFFTFRGVTVLPDGRGKAQSPSRKMFSGRGTILLDDSFFQWNLPQYDHLPGPTEDGSEMTIIESNMRSFDSRDYSMSTVSNLSRITGFLTETKLNTSLNTGDTVSFDLRSRSGCTAMIVDVDKSIIDSNISASTVRCLKVTAVNDSANIFIGGKEVIPITAGKFYAGKVVMASEKTNPVDISGYCYLSIEWLDVDRVSMGITEGWYAQFSALAGTAMTGVAAYPDRTNKRIAQIYNPFQAPTGAAYCKMRYSIRGMNTGQVFYITEHSVYKSGKGA